ncbi:MAG: hypothetical protein AB1772_07775 [Candidatus Zixiibacteriota bacterium]
MHKEFSIQCPSCLQRFSLADFLSNPDLRPLGLTFESADLTTNLFYFHHDVEGCRTTFVIPAVRFIPIMDETIPDVNLAGTASCEAHCVRLEDWLECQNDCFHVPFRRLLRTMARNRGLLVEHDTVREETQP